MKLLALALIFIACMSAAVAQTPPAALKSDEPAELSATEKIAIGAVQREVAQTDQDIMALRIDVARAHPGYNLNIQRGADWTLVPIPKPPAKSEAPAKPTSAQPAKTAIPLPAGKG
jgi:hypothetical protein